MNELLGRDLLYEWTRSMSGAERRDLLRSGSLWDDPDGLDHGE
jgi:hypothetical protein